MITELLGLTKISRSRLVKRWYLSTSKRKNSSLDAKKYCLWSVYHFSQLYTQFLKNISCAIGARKGEVREENNSKLRKKTDFNFDVYRKVTKTTRLLIRAPEPLVHTELAICHQDRIWPWFQSTWRFPFPRCASQPFPRPPFASHCISRILL